MPTRAGSTCHSAARSPHEPKRRLRVGHGELEHLAQRGVVRRGIRVRFDDRQFLSRGRAPGPEMPGNGPRGAAGSSCSVRYLSTKPAMPRALSHFATVDAFVVERERAQRATGCNHDGRARRAGGIGQERRERRVA